MFLATRMSHIPGHFDDNDFENRFTTKSAVTKNVPSFYNLPHKDITAPAVFRYSNTQEYLKTVDPKDNNHVEESFKKAGIDISSTSNFNYLPSPSSAKRDKDQFPENSLMSFDQFVNLNNKQTKSLYNLHDNTTGDSEYRANYQGKTSKINHLSLCLNRD